MSVVAPPSLLSSTLPLLIRPSPYTPPDFDRDITTPLILTEETRVLVVGAGGLGCEILKDLALIGVSDIHVIDLDSIDVSNLNRQFLFRLKDCNRMKAQVAAETITKRCPWTKVKWHTKPIQEFQASWYSQFDVVIAGLSINIIYHLHFFDNIEARQWLNQTLIDLVKFRADGSIDPSSVIPLIDGGTEGFNGQARVIYPRMNACFECSLVSMTPPVGFAVCTIRNVPRLPEHCIAYALKVEWPMLTSFTSPTVYSLYEKKDTSDEYIPANVALDKDNTDHMTWIFTRASQRADQFQISGVTYSLTMQVVKTIIAAIASTNAIISAACVNECFKIRSNCSYVLNSFWMYRGAESTGTYTDTQQYSRNPECLACSDPIIYPTSADISLSSLLTELKEKYELNSPTLSKGAEILYMKNLHSKYAANLDKKMLDLVKSGDLLICNDKNWGTRKILLIFNESNNQHKKDEE